MLMSMYTVTLSVRIFFAKKEWKRHNYDIKIASFRYALYRWPLW